MNQGGRRVFHSVFRARGGTLFYKVDDRYESWFDTVTLAFDPNLALNFILHDSLGSGAVQGAVAKRQAVVRVGEHIDRR